MTVEAGAQGQVAAEVVAAGAAYGRSDRAGRARRSTWSSSRPTRPGRCTSATPGGPSWATRIARVLAAAGAEVTREFYINDRGVQMDQFARLLMVAAAAGRADPRRTGTTATTSPTSPRRSRTPARGSSTLPEDEQLVAFREVGYELQLADQQDALDALPHPLRRVVLRALAARVGDGARDACPAQGAGPRLRGRRRAVDAHHRLRRRQGPRAGQVRRRADLLRLRHRLLRRQARRAASTSASTCWAPTTTATSAGCGRSRPARATTPSQTLDVLIGQLVKILRDGEELRLSKRAGTIVTLEELRRRGRRRRAALHPGRYPADSPLTLDIDEITRQTSENPVYYVQYAPRPHLPRCCATPRELGITPARRVRPRAARPRARGRPAARARGVPAAWSPARPSCASRTGSRATSRTPPRSSTGGTTRSAGCCRRATSR